jgi:hypothetical protein
MTHPAPSDSKQAIFDELESARVTVHRLLDSMSAEDLRRPSNGTKWTNEELLFHMVFGYMITISLIWLVKLLGLFPRRATRVFALSLDALTKPFNTINYIGSVLGAKIYNHDRLGRKFDRTCASLRRMLAAESDRSLRRGMCYPTRWDPFFRNYMTLADVYRYPALHFCFHARQLSVELPERD